MQPTSHRRPPHRGFRVVAVLLVVTVAVLLWRSGAVDSLFNKTKAAAAIESPSPSASPSPSPSPSPLPSPSPTPTTEALPGPINTTFPGLTTFRGNATRDYYGEGPLPRHPVIRWRYPTSGGLCASSKDLFGTRTWCGTGWTGQPNVIQHANGSIEVREGAYDDHYHFLNGLTGRQYRPDLLTGDLAKGSATSDADGFPLYYGGSRDNLLRVVAMDRPAPTIVWSFDADSQPGGMWNDDWDGAPLEIGDYLLEGGENSWFYVIRLHRRYDAKGKVQVNPKTVMRVPGWDQAELDAIGDTDISIEDSVAFDATTGVVYFANSGGLVQGWDISDVLNGGTKYKRVFRFWNGDDTDASIVIDPEGYLYVGRKMEDNVYRPSSFPRDHQIGSLMKLDPRKPKNPLAWSVQLGGFERDGGLLGTPAYYKGTIYATYTEGGFAAINAKTGKLYYTYSLPGPTWGSPVPVDDKLLIGDAAGDLLEFDISNPSKKPKLVWSLDLGGTIESTPAVWHGWIYVGTRGGAIYGISGPK
ncbi:MAG: hypothetical protein E6G47_09995 [Actinobacteria bacterium]|nr:MAG: hypothetical protein E6G47_09995 [Actinomycetota bacterium]